MQLPGISRKLVGMCYNVTNGTSSFSQAGTGLTLRVPFIEQGHVNLCADAVAAMIVQAWGFRTKDGAQLHNDRGAFKGSTIDSHRDIAEAGDVFWSTDNNPKLKSAAELAARLLQFGPLGAGMKTFLGGHQIVVIGAYPNNGEVIVHDPWKGPFKVWKFDSFAKALTSLAWLRQIDRQKMDQQAAPAWRN